MNFFESIIQASIALFVVIILFFIVLPAIMSALGGGAAIAWLLGFVLIGIILLTLWQRSQ
jgi:hypothetical protein